MILKRIKRLIDINKDSIENGNKKKMNMLINHYNETTYDKLKYALKDYNLIEINADSLKYDQIPLGIGSLCLIKLSKDNDFFKKIDDNSILLVKGVDKITISQHRTSLINALYVADNCEPEVKDAMKKLLTSIVFVNTNDNGLLYTIRVLDGKDHFSFYDATDPRIAK